MAKWKVRKLEKCPSMAVRGWLNDEEGREAFVIVYPTGEAVVQEGKHEVLDPRKRAEILTAFHEALGRVEA